jgi:cytochrome c oxidase subunit IV
MNTTPHILPLRVYVLVFAALQALLGVAVAVRYLPLGDWHVPVTLLVASLKALLVALFFMHLRHADRLTQLAACGGLVWLIILLGLTMSDYLSRGTLIIPGK